MWCEQYTPRPPKTPAELAAHFGNKAKAAIASGELLHTIWWYTRLAASYARIVQEQEQEERNLQHRIEVARAFSTLGGVDLIRQEAEDRALTDYLGGRQARLDELDADAHLGAVEES